MRKSSLLTKIGGYDSSRLLTEYVKTQNNDTFDLLDIGIGISSGQSPIVNVSSIGSASGLLKVNNAYAGSQPVQVDGRFPYMYLPSSTCEAIAAYLPLTYNEDIALYTWDIKDPAYRDIITSPSCLSFIFNKDTPLANTTIKIPFALLNLTLTPPLAPEPTPYFPCRPLDLGPNLPIKSYYLGRAFLQQAFFMVDWDSLTDWCIFQKASMKFYKRHILMHKLG